MDNNTFGNAAPGTNPLSNQAPEQAPAAPEQVAMPAQTTEPEPVAAPVSAVSSDPEPAQSAAAPIISSTPETTQEAPTTVAADAKGDANYKGIYGWLILFTVNALFYSINCFSSFMDSFEGSTCVLLDKVGSGTCAAFNNYVSLNNAGFGFLAILNLAVFILIILRKKIAKKIAIAALIADPLITIGLAVALNNLANSLGAPSGTFDDLTTRLNLTIGLTLAYSIVWTLYFLKSERVKKTLVN